MNHFEQTYQLIKYAFNKPDTIKRKNAFKLLYDHSMIFTKSIDDNISHHLLATPFNMKLNNQTVSMAGIGYVATLPEYRGNGGIKELFEQLSQQLDENNIPISLLAPFSQPFYRQFGYETICHHWFYTFDRELFKYLPKNKPGKYERQLLDHNVINKMKTIYQKNLSIQNGSLQRDDWWYQYKELKYPDNTFIAFYTINDQESYLIYHMDHDTFYIDEMAYSNKDELIGLMNFVKNHQMSFKFFKLETANRDLEKIFTDTQYLYIQVKPYMMACIHQIEPIFKLYSMNYSFETPCYIEITNSKNKGIWIIDNNSIHTFPSTYSITPHYSGTIQAFTSLFISGESYHDLSYQLDSITCNQKHPWIEEIINSSLSIYLYDYF